MTSKPGLPSTSQMPDSLLAPPPSSCCFFLGLKESCPAHAHFGDPQKTGAEIVPGKGSSPMWPFWDFFLNFQTFWQRQILASDLSTQYHHLLLEPTLLWSRKGPREKSFLSNSFQSSYPLKVFSSALCHFPKPSNNYCFHFVRSSAAAGRLVKQNFSGSWKSLAKFI